MPKLLNFPMRKLIEGSAEIYTPIMNKISKKMPVFYNPEMKLNRDITILLLKQFPSMNLCDPLAGTGIRAIRFAKELKYKSIIVNDINKKAIALMKKNIKYNKVKLIIKNEDANIMLLKSKGFNFIDLDVFGSPNFMLDSAIKRLTRQGILAVTATDTAPLCGTYPKACQRKYWAIPLRNEFAHEIGLRILIRKIQLIAAQYDKALTPIFSYRKKHYFRVFLKNEKGKNKVDKIIQQHGFFNDVGPIWLGKLYDKNIVNKMFKVSKEDCYKLLKIIKEESKIETIGFYNIHKLCKKYKLKIPAFELIIKKIKSKGYKASRTHFSDLGIKTEMPLDLLVRLIKGIK